MRAWVVKWVIGVALVALIVFEATSPLLAKIQLDSAGAEAALQSRLEYERTHNLDTAKAVAVAEAAKGHAVIEKFEIDSGGGVTLTVYRRAKSIVAYKWKKFATYYDVRASADSKRGLGS